MRKIGKLLILASYYEPFNGSLEIPEINEYIAFVAYFQAAQTAPMIGVRNENLIVFTGSLIAAGNNPYISYSTLTVSENTVTFRHGANLIALYGLF